LVAVIEDDIEPLFIELLDELLDMLDVLAALVGAAIAPDCAEAGAAKTRSAALAIRAARMCFMPPTFGARLRRLPQKAKLYCLGQDLFALAGAQPVGFVEQPFANAQRLRRHFDQFVVFDELDRPFERQIVGRR
jgi:hypothetical protein